MSCTIREFCAADYPALAGIHNALYPEHPTTPEEPRFYDERWDPKCHRQRWAAESEGRPVACAELCQWPWEYDPRRFHVEVKVHPDHQGHGLGSALYDHLLQALEPLDPIALQTVVREDKGRGLAFVVARGFQECRREWDSLLQLASFGPTPYAGLEGKLGEHGIEIHSLSELESDADRDRKLYELHQQVSKDAPGLGEPTRVPFEFFARNEFENADLLPEAYFVAVHEGEYVGVSNLRSTQVAGELDTGTTGVVRAYRHRGLATALKVRALTWAQDHGYATVRTSNDSENSAMLSINFKLGFVRQLAWIRFEKAWAAATVSGYG